MTSNTTRQLFRFFNQFMVLMWRLGLGPLINIWPPVIGRIMVITHSGRKTGLRRRTPVNYALMDGEVYCTAGYGAASDWYQNILSSPDIEIWLPQGDWSAEAFPADDQANRLKILRLILINSGFAAPLFSGINPKKISDLELELIVKDYRLIRIQRKQVNTGFDGSSDLAWIWIVIALAAIAGRLVKRINKICTQKRSR